MKKQKVLISGGGIPGLSMALALSRLDLDVTLAEPYPPKAFDEIKDTLDGRTAAIMIENISFLGDVWERVKPYAGRLEVMRVIDDSIEGRAPAQPHDFKSASVSKEVFAYNTPLQLLRSALWEALPSHVNCHPGLDPGSASNDFDLIIAADGRNSHWREYAGIQAHIEETGQAALTFVAEMAQPHGNVSSETHRPNGPVTFVPLKNPHQCSVVFVDKEATQKALLDKGVEAIEKKLQNYCHSGESRNPRQHIINAGDPDLLRDDSLKILTPPILTPLSFLRVDALYKNNIVLTAEAAHVLHPLGAQGLNLSLKDMSQLFDFIQKSLSTGGKVNDPVHVLEPYAKARAHDHALRHLAVRISLQFLEHGKMTGGVRRGFLDFLKHVPAVEKTILRSVK